MISEDFHEDFEYCGDCPVCDEPVDHTDAGFCGDCGKAFHWGDCGTWEERQHKCNNCMKEGNEK